MIFRDQCLQLIPQLEATLQFTDADLVQWMQEDERHVVKVRNTKQVKEMLDVAHEALEHISDIH